MKIYKILCILILTLLFSIHAMAAGAIERFTLDLNGIEVRELLKIVSIKSGYTIVPTKHVQGRVSVYLNNVDFHEALDVIAMSADLAYELKGNLVKFMTTQEYQILNGRSFNERRIEKEFICINSDPSMIKSVLDQLLSEIGNVILDKYSATLIIYDTPENVDRLLAVAEKLDRPTEKELFQLNYAKSDELKNQLSELADKEDLLTIADKRTNSIMISGSQKHIAESRNLVSVFDAPEKQVEIESTIVEVTLSDTFSRGIDWSVIFRGVDDIAIRSAFPKISTTDFGQVSVGSLDENSYTALMQLLETQGDVQTRSNPRIVVLNNEEAKLHVGAREPVVIARNDTELESNSIVKTDEIDYVDIGVNLFVAPVISNDGYIRLKIKPEINSIRETIVTEAGSRIPVVETSLIETSVKIKDGKRLMISGLVKNYEKKDENGVPLLSKMPLVKNIFGNKSESKSVVEYVVFLRPKITDGSDSNDSDYSRVVKEEKDNVEE